MLQSTKCAALLLFGFLALASASYGAPARLVVGYFAAWGDSPEHRVDQIPGELLTHVIYAFGKIEAGEIVSDNVAHFDELRALKKKYPHLKTLISLGGWGGSGKFSETALTEESRAKFARSCAAFLQQRGFEGIDIDWEYPTGGASETDKGRDEDTLNFTLLIRLLRAALDEQGKSDGTKYLLTMAAPAGPQNIVKFQIGQVHASLDWINVMTYDYTGMWSPITCFNAPLFAPSADPRASLSAATTMRAYLNAGVPPEKLVLGVPFYGHAFGGVPNVDHGLFQPHDKKRLRPPGDGEWTYRAIVANSIGKMQRYWHDVGKVPWLFDAESGVMISYDDPESIRIKAEFARDQRFAGVMIWELSQDDDAHTLLKSLNEGLQPK